MSAALATIPTPWTPFDEARARVVCDRLRISLAWYKRITSGRQLAEDYASVVDAVDAEMQAQSGEEW